MNKKTAITIFILAAFVLFLLAIQGVYTVLNSASLLGAHLSQQNAVAAAEQEIPELSRNDQHWRLFFDSICEVESNCDPNAVGDNGNAIGAYQIWEPYWIDACNHRKWDRLSLDDGYESCLDKEYSELVMFVYWNRYATEKRLGRTPTWEDFARIHNGGPNGYKKDSTKGYWEKVKAVWKDKLK